MSYSTLANRARRERYKAEGRSDEYKAASRKYRAAKRIAKQQDRPFIGCDGEGCGTDDLGRQLYMLFRMGERELFTGRPLRTKELLDFICDEPAAGILVGFAFGYDVTMILRDLPEKQQRRLFEPKTFGEGKSPFVWYKDFDIDYLPKQYLKVRRVRIERDENGREKRVVIKGSTRTIWETFGFFQKSFVKCIETFGCGDSAGRLAIAADKERRSSFSEISQRERDYCALECEYLAELMEKLRSYCNDADIAPQSWSGAGKLASALHRKHETIKNRDLKSIPAAVVDLANMAYYGGRFEITRTGAIKERVYEYDIRSAYPDAMRGLPCLVHGQWEKVDAATLAALARDIRGRRDDPLFVAVCTFKTARQNDGIGQLGGLPVRSKEGHLYWPLQGGGVYWSCEIASARNLGVQCSLKSGYRYIRCCDCRPFEWVEPLYEYRRSIGSAGPGYPIKLGINSLYGKLAQRKGNGVYNNMIWAGLITARTRAKLNNAISISPDKIIMVATDAVYATVPLSSLDCGERLGQWEMAALDGLFMVQPGLYWCPNKRKRKSRGLSGKFFEEPGRTESFEQAWDRWHEEQNSKLLTDFPTVPVPVPGFIGMKLAISRNKPDLAGTWVHDQRLISFDYRNKRQGHIWQDDHIVTGIKAGYPGLMSLPHRDFLAAGGHEPWEEARLMLEEQPDYIDLGIPFKD